MDDNEKTQFALNTLATAVGVVSPIAGAGMAIAANWLTAVKIDGAWRSAGDDLWAEVLVAESNERKEQYKDFRDEFSKHWHIIEWLQDELEKLQVRVDALESTALGLADMAGEMIRIRPEPEMREYLAAALHNSLYRRDIFTASWVRRLGKILASVGAEHIGVLRILMAAQGNESLIRKPVAWWEDYQGGDNKFVLNELESLELLMPPKQSHKDPSGVVMTTGYILPLGRKLLEFVSRDETTQNVPSSSAP